MHVYNVRILADWFKFGGTIITNLIVAMHCRLVILSGWFASYILKTEVWLRDWKSKILAIECEKDEKRHTNQPRIKWESIK